MNFFRRSTPQQHLHARWQWAERWLSNQTLDRFSYVLDESIPVPGTSMHLGLDGLIGLIPGFGDLIAGLASLLLIVAAWLRGVPYVTLARMLLNLAFSVLIGSIPLVGDLLVIQWKSNRRNYRLLRRELHMPRRGTWRDGLFLLFALCLTLIAFMIPLLVLILLILLIVHGLRRDLHLLQRA